MLSGLLHYYCLVFISLLVGMIKDKKLRQVRIELLRVNKILIKNKRFQIPYKFYLHSKTYLLEHISQFLESGTYYAYLGTWNLLCYRFQSRF